jgi:hydroxycarboxylate dehydrogenase B
MTADFSIIEAGKLREFATRLFEAAGVSGADALLIAKSLVDANLCGHESHGVVRILEYVELLSAGGLKSGVELLVESETPALVVCDGQSGFGQVQMRRLIETLIPKAKSLGLACGTMRNCGHVGRLGEWCEQLAGRGLASFLTVNDNGVLKCVAPPGGTTPVISTNPVAIGAPGNPRPLVVDASTSVVANGKIRVAQLAGESCPEGWLIDAGGNSTTDPNDRFADPPGSILPLGGYKGFGLGLLLDALVGGLSGGQCPPAPDGTIECNNVLLVVFSPEHFGGVEHFSRQLADLTEFARSSQRMEPETAIRLPGDRSNDLRSSRLADGIPLAAGTCGELSGVAKRLNVADPFE